jgi:hypothetical protein
VNGQNQPVDTRSAIREILITNGAPLEDLEWLVASCPGEPEAMAYRPTQRMAWCALCDGPREVDARGCVGCRAAIGGAS